MISQELQEIFHSIPTQNQYLQEDAVLYDSVTLIKTHKMKKVN